MISLFFVIFTYNLFNFTQPQFNWFRPLYEETNFYKPLHSTSPVVYNEIIIAPGKNVLKGLNKHNGRLIWSREFSNEISSSPVLYSDRVFLSVIGGKIYTINPENGAIIKEVTIINSSIISDFVFVENKAIFKTDKDELIAIDINSGEILWSYRRKNISEFTINLFSAPLIHNDIVYAGFSDGVLAGVNLTTGKEQWSLKLPPAKRFEGIYATPVVYKDTLIVPKYDSGLYSISIQDKKILWAKEDDGYLWCEIYDREVPISDRTSDDSLYCASISGKLLKINLHSGNSYWLTNFLNTRSLFKTKLLSLSKPAISNNTMFLIASHELYAINLKDGKIVWKFRPTGVLFPVGVSSTPVVNGDTLVFVSNSGLLYNFQIIK